jgi:hypothetical protein
MNQDIIEMAKQSHVVPYIVGPKNNEYLGRLEAFAKLVAAKERERIIAENKSEIEKCNVYIKELETRLYASNVLRGEA